jgi:hypothetical protein
MERDLREKVREQAAERAGAKRNKMKKVCPDMGKDQADASNLPEEKRNKMKKICPDPGKDQANASDLPEEEEVEKEEDHKAVHKNKLLINIKSHEKKYCNSTGKRDPVGSFWPLSAICIN